MFAKYSLSFLLLAVWLTKSALPRTALALLSLGIVRAEKGDLEGALQLMSESLEFHLATLGKQHLKTLACYYRLGWLCRLLGDNHRSESVHFQLPGFTVWSQFGSSVIGQVFSALANGSPSLRQLLIICMDSYRAIPNPPKPELARAMFQLSLVLAGAKSAKSRCSELMHQSRKLLVDILLSKGDSVVSDADLAEADFDQQIAYYYR